MSTQPDLRVIRSYEALEALPEHLRPLVHEYGLPIVQACLMAGVTRPNIIHQLVREIWEGARASRQNRQRSGVLDWLLVQAGAEITSPELARALKMNNLQIVPAVPTARMINASLAEVSGFNQRVTKTEKHRLRLAAALKAEENYFERLSEPRVKLVQR